MINSTMYFIRGLGPVLKIHSTTEEYQVSTPENTRKYINIVIIPRQAFNDAKLTKPFVPNLEDRKFKVSGVKGLDTIEMMI